MERNLERSVMVVVVTYNSEKLLPDFFDSLDDGLSGIESFEVVVADNASADGTIAVTKQYRPDATIVTLDRNRGYAAGINAAVRVGASANAILVLNDDIRLQPGAVARMLTELENPKVGIVVPRLVDGDGHLLESQRREPTIRRSFGEAVLGGTRSRRVPWLSEIVQDRGMYDETRDITWASGCAWLIADSCWQRVGPWDETFFLYAEDLDYALRAKEAGFTIRYTPNAGAIHLVGPSHSDPRLWSMAIWNRFRLYRRRHGWLPSSLYWCGLVVNELVRGIAGQTVHQAGLAALVSSRRRPPEVRSP